MSDSLAGFLEDHSTVLASQYFSTTAYILAAVATSISRVLYGPIQEIPATSHKDGLDVAMNIWAYKRLREIMRSTRMFTGELRTAHLMFLDGSEAACVVNIDSKSVVVDPRYTA